MRVITVEKSSVSGDDTRATQPSLCLLKAEHGVLMEELTGQMDKRIRAGGKLELQRENLNH